ncbi:MAG: lipopolysaccharide biosynthesis protein [Actinomycetota bacterium]|nr:lipopolysaccharide biosynthesis protein [Actinomycetota bacterium]
MTSPPPPAPPAADVPEQHPVVLRLETGVPLGRGAKQGAVWAVGSKVVSQFVQFLGTIITARLLLPSDFGITAVVFPVLTFGAIFNTLGLSSAIIHVHRVTEKLLSTVFYVHAAMSVLLTAIVALLAAPLAVLFDIPALTPVLMLASLIFVLNRSLVPTALLERTLRFKQIAVVETVCAALGIVTTVVAAVAGAGAYSLVLGPLVDQATRSFGSYALVRWRPRARPDRESLRELWTFTRGITGFSLLNFWSRNADNLLLARFVDLTSLGYYNRAYNLMRLPVLQVNIAMSRVLVPAITRLRDDRPRMGRAWLRALAATGAAAAPVTLGMAVAAPAMIEVLLGRRWLGMVDVLQVLALSALPQTLTTTVAGLLRATGATDTLFRLGLLTSAMSLAAMLIGLPWGTLGVATALAVKFYLEVLVSLRPCLRETGLRWRDLVRALRGVWFASMALAAAGLAVRLGVPDSLPAWQVLLAQVSACAVAYLAALWVVDREPVLLVANGLRGLARRRRPAVVPSSAPAERS